MEIVGLLIAGFVTTLLVLLYLWVFGKVPYLRQVKATAMS